ncbi:bifunctional 4-hydroxy-2-oxoglutarate aldolase/2-dehydro-3-deoxy-phosphogluconate aldolase [Hungatella hominis]|uniref:Bifunctional 4-hydroxy-2-oxoglutarate aldolase/2-dehydro-3-deoxy-phosphogluconate aldolase n=1 Tax=Hungatella hominis TaxID=2763050 RepID=A0ABR7HES4_9FIRM|nr:bifunctional 4-hydroxy-2-oxoglutarate aldolase/2-dehydro-3-deoxy-phosphogluconate aldolase [Hungatella hominis]MBC5711647.1 bifunctional 4-hydroxy-2-oxoglutarate aldolase/2-dehydro-3-deoxy-phosphogluconate aldolase [Hungatella hominis]
MIESIRLMAIIRDVEPLYAVPIAETLVSEGITGIEVSLSDAEKGFGCIENIQKRFSPDEICLGAGTVTKKEEVDRLAAMKIPFFLTPGYDDELVAYGLSKGMEVLPGVLTPGEVQKALNRGVRRLKLFPADAFGMSYIKSLKGPFPQAEFVAVGGVNETNVSQFLKAGFAGAAAGSNLVPRKSTDGNLELIRQKARLYVQAMEREA